MAYYSDKLTDKGLEALEKRIAEVFKQAEKDLDKEVKEYFEEEGLDISGMSLEELKDLEEVFEIEDGRFLIVEG